MRKPWHVLNMSGYRDWSCLSPSCYTHSDNWHRNPNELRIKPAAKAAGERPVRSSVECRCCIFNEGLVWLLQCYNATLLPLNIFADKKKLLKLLLIVESIITSFLNLACVDQTRWIASECRVRFIKQPTKKPLPAVWSKAAAAGTAAAVGQGKNWSAGRLVGIRVIGLCELDQACYLAWAATISYPAISSDNEFAINILLLNLINIQYRSFYLLYRPRP